MTGAPSRREMLRRSFAAAGIPALCCTTPELPSASFTLSDTSLVIDLDRAPFLLDKRAAAKVIDRTRGLNLIVVHSGRNRFAALDRSCTHGAAQVVFNDVNGTVQCTSWGHSEFALDGTVLGGSAKRPLKRYDVRRTGNKLEILL